MVAGARDNPFSPEEAELFQIFILQGEAALRNLELLEEIKKLAMRDGLTGLYNYRHFWELLVHEIMKSRRYQVPLSVLFLDLDNFKIINDTLGHLQGDMALKSLGAYLQRGVRQADVACRYGGEEFRGAAAGDGAHAGHPGGGAAAASNLQYDHFLAGPGLARYREYRGGGADAADGRRGPGGRSRRRHVPGQAGGEEPGVRSRARFRPGKNREAAAGEGELRE